MLSQIRDRATGWIAWAIVIIITIPFALWGINSYFEGLTQVDVAIVDGEEIDYQTYQNAVSERRRFMLQTLGGRVDPDVFNSDEFKTQVLDDLIDDVLLSNEARRFGYRVSDAQLAAWIQSLPQFQRDGAFDRALYEDVLRRVGYTVAQFESLQRRQSTLDQLRTAYGDSAFVTDSDVNNLLKLIYERRQAEYVTLTPEMFTGDVEVSDAEIEQEYQANTERYRERARLKVAYVELSVDELAQAITPSEDELRQLYDESEQRFVAPEQRRASHILVALAEDADEAARKAALDKAVDLAAQARAGTDFAELAREHSDDSGSAANGGDLGVISRGVMVAPFEQAVYDMEEGAISDPVETRYGYHVIRLAEVVPERRKTFEEVRTQLEEQERRRQAEALFLHNAETFRNLVYEQPESLEPVAEELRLEIKESDWFTSSQGEGVAANPRMREVAFGEEVLEGGLNSEVIEIGLNSLVAVRKLAYEESKLSPLGQVRDAIRTELQRAKAATKAEEAGEEMLKALRGGAEWERMLEERGLTVTPLPELRSEATANEARAVAEAVFAAPRPAAEPVFGGASAEFGNYAVYRLSSVTAGDPEGIEESERARVVELLRQRQGVDYFLAYRQGLRDRADVTVFTEQL